MKGFSSPSSSHEGGAHGTGVLVAELEDLGHLDAASAFQRKSARRAAIAGLHRGQIGPLVHLEILAQTCTHVVIAVLVGAHYPTAGWPASW